MSATRTISSYLKLLSTKKTMAYDVENCCGVKPFNGIQPPLLLTFKTHYSYDSGTHILHYCLITVISHHKLFCLLSYYIYIYKSTKETIQRFLFKYICYVKTKTIVYYHLRQCFRETRLSSQNKQ